MKIRLGFVTNSSSSSFILRYESLKGIEVSSRKDEVFKLIQEAYRVLSAKVCIAKIHLLNRGYKLAEGDEGIYYILKFNEKIDTNIIDKHSKEMEEELERLFGLDILDLWCILDKDSGVDTLLSCSSYAEYLDKESIMSRKFDIEDYEKDTISWDTIDILGYLKISKEELMRIGDIAINYSDGAFTPFIVNRLEGISKKSINHI